MANCPINIRVLPDLSRIMFSGIDPCALGSIVEVLVSIDAMSFALVAVATLGVGILLVHLN